MKKNKKNKFVKNKWSTMNLNFQDKISFAERIVRDIVKLIKSRDPKANERILMLLKERESYGDSPLHSALRYGQLHLVKCILMLLASSPEFKPIVNLQTSSGRVSISDLPVILKR